MSPLDVAAPALPEATQVAVDHLARAFRGGGQLRAALDASWERHGSLAWGSAAAQNELLRQTVLYKPSAAPSGFTFGERRCAAFVRLLVHETEQLGAGVLDEELACVAAEYCARRTGGGLGTGRVAVWVVLGVPTAGGGVREAVLRVSELVSSLGLRLWAAGFVMYEEIVHADSVVHADVSGRRVLELGAGTGICAGAFAEARVAHVVLTDLQADVVENMRENVRQNVREDFAGRMQTAVLDMCDVEGAATMAARHDVDTVLAADVTYDPELVQVVVRAFERLLVGSGRVGYLFATKRSEEGFALLHGLLRESRLDVVDVERRCGVTQVDWLLEWELDSVHVFRLRGGGEL